MEKNILLLEARGGSNNDGVLNNYRCCCPVVTKDGKRGFISLGSWVIHETRYINKKTGKQLKHPVTEIVNPAALSIDLEIDKKEAGTDGYIWERSYHGLYSGRYGEKLNRLDYNAGNILKAIEAITGIKYDGFQVLPIKDRLPEPAAFAAIKARETVEAITGYIEKEARKVSDDIENLQQLKQGQKIINRHIASLEDYSGITEAEKARIGRQVETGGSWREKTYFNAVNRCIVKLPGSQGGHTVYRVYNLKQDSHGVIHYFEVTETGRFTA